MNEAAQHHGVLWNALGAGMFAASTLVMMAVVSRTSDIATIGAFSFAIIVAQQLYILGGFGVTEYQMTDYRRQFDFADYFWLRVVSTAAMVVLGVALAFVLGADSWTKGAFIIGLVLVYTGHSAADLYQSLFFQNNRLDLAGQSIFIRVGLALIVFTVVCFLTDNPVAALVGMLIVNVGLVGWLGLWRARPFSHSEHHFDRGRVLMLARENWPLFVAVFAMTLVLSMPRFMIEALMDDTAQGYFGLIFIPVFVVNLISQFIFRPSLHRYAMLAESGQRGAFARAVLRQLGIILGLTVALIAGLALLGVPVLSWFFGQDLAPVHDELVTLAVGSGLLAVTNMGYYLLVVMRRQRDTLLIYAIGLVVAVGSEWVGISDGGLMGACVAFVVTQLTTALLAAVFVARGVARRVAR